MIFYLDNSKIHPRITKTLPHKIVTITCKTDFRVVRWTFNGNVPPMNVIYKKNQLHIVNVEERNAGEYICEGRINETYEWTNDNVPFFAKSVVKIVGMNRSN